MKNLIQKIKDLLNKLLGMFKDLFKPNDITVSKPIDPPPVNKIPTISEPISQVAPEQKGSITDKLFGISPEEAQRRADYAAAMNKGDAIPTIGSGSTVSDLGKIYHLQVKVGSTNINVTYTGKVKFNLYEQPGTDPTAYMGLACNGVVALVPGHSSLLGGITFTGPGTVTITSNKTHMVDVVMHPAK